MKGRHENTYFAFIIMTFFIGILCEKLPYGSPCETDIQCRDEGSDSTMDFNSDIFFNDVSDDGYSVCKNARCNCSTYGMNLQVFKNNNYECASTLYGDIPKCKVNDPETCLNGVCKIHIGEGQCKCNFGFVYVGDNCKETVTVDYAEDCKTPENGSVPVCDHNLMMRCNSDEKCGCYKDFFYDEENKTCISKAAFVEKYPEETLAGLDEFCGKSDRGLPKVCDETTNMSCRSSKCKCTRKFYPLEANNTCESKESYIQEHNLTEYKVMPGIYCYSDIDCITGLDCYNETCACPHPCMFDNKASACDCGQVSVLEGASQPILVGVIGGLVIIYFWGHFINKTMKKRQKATDSRTPVRTEMKSSTVYSNAASVSNQPPVTFSVCHTSPQSDSTFPDSNQAPSPVPPYPVSPLSNSTAPVGFTAPIAPPPDATQQPPQYALNSTPYPTSQATPSSGYSTTPAADTPYPLNPTPGTVSSGSSDMVPTQYSGTVPTTYPLSGPSAPPSYTPSTQTVTSDPPPYDIYKPIIS